MGPYVHLAFFWLALRTLTFWVCGETTIRSLKVNLLGGVQKSAKFRFAVAPLSCREVADLCLLRHADAGPACAAPGAPKAAEAEVRVMWEYRVELQKGLEFTSP